MKIIVGIGNPGRKYHETRHNVGYLVIDHISSRWGIRVFQGKALSLVGEGSHFGEPVVLAKPVTFVNRSGVAAIRLLELYRVRIEEFLVVCDDFNLSLGRMRIRRGRGDGGHGGLHSITESIGKADFPRIRVGIGEIPEGTNSREFVLRSWDVGEREKIQPVIERAGDSLSLWLRTGSLDEAMNRYN